MTTITDNLDFLCVDGMTLDDTGAGPARSRTAIAKLGKFKDGRYGTFTITRKDFDGWQRNLSLFGGEVPVDVDHSPEKRGVTEAAGWIKGLELGDDGIVWADIEWTALGEQALREKRYRFMSATFHNNLPDETGKRHGPALQGAALTNRPFLSLPAVTLDADYADALTLAVDEGRVSADLRHHFEELWSLNPELAAKTLDDLPKPNRSDRMPDTIEKPSGRVDDYGYVLLPAGTDLDGLLADEVAPRRAWRQLREHDQRILEDGGQRSGYDTAQHDPVGRFVSEWRAYVDAGRDLVATVKLRAWEADQQRQARAQQIKDDRAAAEEARKAEAKRQVKLLAEDMQAYGELMADIEGDGGRVGAGRVIPPTFDQFQRQRQRERGDFGGRR
jgi:hypothetical protein